MTETAKFSLIWLQLTTLANNTSNIIILGGHIPHMRRPILWLVAA